MGHQSPHAEETHVPARAIQGADLVLTPRSLGAAHGLRLTPELSVLAEL